MNGEVYRAAISNLSIILEEGGRGRESVLGEKLRSRARTTAERSQKPPQQGPTETALSSALQGEKTVDQGLSKGGVDAGRGVGEERTKVFRMLVEQTLSWPSGSIACELPHALSKDSPA
ncbi:hypothetical protein L207DRAFT_566691 [Hyaloscypha variabilis F]|uniref:Uncharacterized protein n=1 Tax=Hyaloscypha variabilis (strain UAMH 11265 / GT02V1 / F) TaxID=1149755 RepID=A0A2J6RMR9_HYAVF|nr:hypothetical protein L207DRAFT_566691 [Hyaloscypha variabilis F]